MMKLPKIVVSQKEYNDQIAALLKDQECIIFLDTNILAKMYALYKGARHEFYSWVRVNKDDNRIKIPAWCINEYTNKVVRNELAQYTSSVSNSLQTNERNLSQLVKHLTFYIDDKTAIDQGYTSRNDYLIKVAAAQQKLTDTIISSAIAKSIANSQADIHHEIIEVFTDIILKSNIFKIMEKSYDDYQTRFANKVPPGFQDIGKGRNEIGDYIIWRELLEAAADGQIKKVLYVSNDVKIDWVYTPPLIITAQSGGKPKGYGPKDEKISLIDTRLEYEISLAAGAPVEIMLINFEQLVHTLTRENPGTFQLLSDAIQTLKLSEISNTIDTTDASIIAGETQEPVVTDTEQAISETEEVLQETESKPNVNPLLQQYSSSALADATYAIPNTDIGNIIALLKSNTWDTQNSGINSLSVKKLNSASTDELFVLGRNILQSATGSAFGAISLINNFPGSYHLASEEALQHLFNGMLYEVYFDSQSMFRGSNGKTLYMDELYKSYRNNPKLNKCGEFIAAALAGYERQVLYIPTIQQNTHTLTLSFKSLDSERSFYDSTLDACFLDKKDILQRIDDDEDSRVGGLKWLRYYNNNVEQIQDAVRYSRYIPEEFVSYKYKLDGKLVNKLAVSDFIIPRDLYI